MLSLPVPDYFQQETEDAQRSRVQWLEAEVSLGDQFFAKMLRVEEGSFTRWKEGRTSLAGDELLGLREVWEIMMHILSFVNFDSGRARQLLTHIPAASSWNRGIAELPPWAGLSIETYLETQGITAVDDVKRWITSFRFGAPTLTPEAEVPCPSSQV